MTEGKPMSDEKLTEEEREDLATWRTSQVAAAKAIRIIDALTARVAELENASAVRAVEFIGLHNDLATALARADAAEQARDAAFVELNETLDRAESEAAALRAELAERCSRIAELKGLGLELESRLAAANALLQEVWDNGDIPRKIGLRIQRHLSSQAPTEREAAERRVLEAMAGAEIRRDRDGYPYFSDTTRVVCEAELARRAVKP